MVPRWNELRLGSPEAATSSWTRPLGLAGAADRRGHRCGPRDRSRLSAGRRDPGARSRAARRTGGKTSHFRGGVHRLFAGKTSDGCAGVCRDGKPRATRAPSASACEPYRELIVEALGHGRNAVAIWQDLVDDHGFSARYASVRRFVLTLRGTAPAEARVVITTAPGEQG